MRALLLAATMLAPFTVHAQSVILPAVPKAFAPGQVEGMLLQTNSPTAVPATYRTTGIVFPAGTVPAGALLQATVGHLGYVTPAQMDERTHWPDGSVRTASLSFRTPPYRAHAPQAGIVFRLGGTDAAPVSLAAFTPGVATVDVARQGGATWHLDLAQLLTAGYTTWLSGPVATEARVDAPIEGAMHVTIDARIYADGSSQLDVIFANDLALAAGGPVSYTATITLGSQSFTQTIAAQQPFTDWHHVVYSTGAAPVGNLVHDVALLEATGMVPHYPLIGVQQSEIDGEVALNSCAPLSPCGFTPYMPTTGGRGDIGLVPRWDAIWLQTQDAGAAAYALAQADAAGSVPWHVEQTPGVPVLVTQHPNWWSDDRCSQNGNPDCSPMSYQAASDGSGNGVPISPDTSHQPELAYVAYLLTGERYYLDELAAQAGYSEMSAYPAIRTYSGQTGDLVIGPYQQLRGGAWSIRELTLAALAEPDGSGLQAYFAKANGDNMAYVAQDANDPSKGELVGFIDGYCSTGAFSPWQEDYFALSLEWAVHAGVPGAQTALAAMTPFLVNRFNQPAATFSPFDGTAYNLVIGPDGNSYYTTWAQVEQATRAVGRSNTAAPLGPPPGTWEWDYGVAATSVVAGLPSSPAQQQALAWINAHPAAPAGQINPAWEINP